MTGLVMTPLLDIGEHTSCFAVTEAAEPTFTHTRVNLFSKNVIAYGDTYLVNPTLVGNMRGGIKGKVIVDGLCQASSWLP